MKIQSLLFFEQSGRNIPIQAEYSNTVKIKAVLFKGEEYADKHS
jgi:hypothetical protein